MQGNRQKTLIMLTALVVFSVALLLFAQRDQSLHRLQKAKTIRIGYAVEAPYAFRKDGEVTGEFPEVAKWVAIQLGIQQIEWIQTDFDLLLTELEADRFDVIATGMYITEERMTRVAFSIPVVRTQQGLLVRRGNPKQIHSYQQARQAPELKFAVIAGAIEELLLQRIGLRAEQIVIVPDARTGRTAVENGLVDGLALTAPTIRWMVLNEGLQETTMAQPFVQPALALTEDLSNCAFAFRKGDQQLLTAWNQVMQPLIHSEAHLKLSKKYGFTLPNQPTTAEILSR